MATFKACVRRQRNDGLYTVFVRVTHKRDARYIDTGKAVDKSKLRKGEIKDPDIISRNYILFTPNIEFWIENSKSV